MEIGGPTLTLLDKPWNMASLQWNIPFLQSITFFREHKCFLILSYEVTHPHGGFIPMLQTKILTLSNVIFRPAALVLPGSWLDMQHLRPCCIMICSLKGFPGDVRAHQNVEALD